MLCPKCGGAQSVHETPYARTPCTTCAATGEVDAVVFREYVEAHPHSPAAHLFEERATSVPCPACRHCPHCAGSRMVSPAKAVEIRAMIAGAQDKT